MTTKSVIELCREFREEQHCSIDRLIVILFCVIDSLT